MARKLIIIGSGPAGYTAAIYAARANLAPLLFEGVSAGGQPGGQLMTTTEVENFPGFPKGVMGPDLMLSMKEQAVRFGVELVPADVDRVAFGQQPFKVFSGDRVDEAHAVIVATGATARVLDHPSVRRLWGRGVSACATCDGALPIFRGQQLAVVGGGDSAIEEATFLTRFAASVAIIHRRDQLRASKAMQERAKTNPKITLVWDSVIDEVLGEQAVTGLRLKNVKTGAKHEIAVKGLFMGIGHTPNTGFLAGQLQTNEAGYLVVRHPTTATSVDGVFAAGDVADPHYRQAITAAGSGCAAALDAERWLAAWGLG